MGEIADKTLCLSSREMQWGRCSGGDSREMQQVAGSQHDDYLGSAGEVAAKMLCLWERQWFPARATRT